MTPTVETRALGRSARARRDARAAARIRP